MTGQTDSEARRRAELEHWRRQETARANRESESKRRAEEQTRATKLQKELASLEAEHEQLSGRLVNGGSLDRADKHTLGWWALGWVPATAIWFVSVFLLDQSDAIDLKANATSGVLIVMLLPVFFWIPPLVRMARRRSAVTGRLREVRSRIGGIKEQLAKLMPRGHRSSGGFSTVRQAQHAWYGEHSELNWHHREQGQALGFDNAHDYVNNFLESD